jgi:hypothetical protein
MADKHEAVALPVANRHHSILESAFPNVRIGERVEEYDRIHKLKAYSSPGQPLHTHSLRPFDNSSDPTGSDERRCRGGGEQ